MTENGSAKWQIGFWVITFLVVGSFTWTTLCYSQNQMRIEHNRDMLFEMNEQLKDYLHKIDLRLSRIEDKLGVPNESGRVRVL